MIKKRSEFNFQRKGQVALFIVVGIVLVAGVILLLLVRSNTLNLPTGNEFSPSAFMEGCVRESLRDTSKRLLEQGGVLEPKNYVLINGTRIAYLCKTINYIEPCVNQYPLYISQLQREFERVVGEDASLCFESLREELEKRSYTLEGGIGRSTVTLKPDVVEVSIPSTLVLARNGEEQRISAFDMSLRSPLHSLALVAQEIVAQEASYCYFEYVGYMILYPSYDIRVTTQSDASKLYTVTHLPSDTRLQFAVRGCAFPAGL